jgi:hypothetical protein
MWPRGFATQAQKNRIRTRSCAPALRLILQVAAALGVLNGYCAKVKGELVETEQPAGKVSHKQWRVGLYTQDGGGYSARHWAYLKAEGEDLRRLILLSRRIFTYDHRLKLLAHR